jgi:spermidine/putrescine transport system permease protein
MTGTVLCLVIAFPMAYWMAVKLAPKWREASRDLGGTAWDTLWRITVPLAAPGVTAGMLLVFVPLMGDYITPTVLGGASGSMVGQMVAAQFQSAQNWALGAAMAVLLMLAIFGTSAVVGGVLKVSGHIISAMTSLKLPSKEPS